MAAMPKWEKSSPERVAFFDGIVPARPGLERRQMFGYPCCFINGNMCFGLHQDDFILRLPDDALREILDVPGARRFEPMPGRAMKGYAIAPGSITADRRLLDGWLSRSADFVASLPPKAKAGRAKKAAGAKKRRA